MEFNHSFLYGNAMYPDQISLPKCEEEVEIEDEDESDDDNGTAPMKKTEKAKWTTDEVFDSLSFSVIERFN